MADDPTNAANPLPPGLEPTHAPASSSEPAVLEGSLRGQTFGRYQLIAELGRGAMGVVYKARDPALDRLVALKVLARDAKPEWRAMFRREGQAAAGLSNPHVCAVHDVGEEDGCAFLAMAYIEGQTLGTYARAKGPGARAAVALVRPVAAAMGEAHARGIVHRDLKPANVMIDAKGRPVVVDFGLALRLESADPRHTAPGAVMGTPSYMAPEQARGDLAAVGPPADVWALGVILFELVTGQKPFAGTSTYDLLEKIVRAPAPAPRALRPELDAELEAVIVRCLAKDPAARYATGTELAAALDAYLTPPLSLDDPAPPVPPPKRKKWPLVAGAAALLLAAGIAAGVYFARDRGSPVAEKQPDAPAVNGGDKGQPPSVVPPKPDPGKDKPAPPPMIALAPGEGTNFRAGDYEYLIDATKDGAKKWLGTQKAAKHSVMWLDAYPVGNGTKFTAVAALDARQANWLVTLDEPIAKSAEWVPSTFAESKTHTLVSLSGYPSGKQLRAALLWHPGDTPSLAHPSVIGWRVGQQLPNERETVAQLRIHSYEGLAFLSVNRTKGERFTHTFGERAPATEAYLEKARAPGLRPGAVSACQSNGDTVFAATMIEDPGAMEYKFHVSLTESQLKTFVEIATALNFVPTSLTGYETNEGTRFCTVWVRYAQKKPELPKPFVALDPKDGRVIAVPGYEYLIDATHAGARKWLDAHKDAKHSVLWLDSYMIGGRKGVPKFAALVALDARQPDWLAQLDVKYNTFVNNPSRGFSDIDRKRYALISHSHYADDGDELVAVLWHVGPFNDTTAFVLARDTAGIRHRFAQGRALQVRPHPTDDQSLFWSMHFEAKEGKGSQLVEATRAEVETFFAEKGKPGMRPSSAAAVTYLGEDGWFKQRAKMWPGSVAVVIYKGAPVFGATVIDDRDAAAYGYSLSLSPAEFAEKADAVTKAGMVPVSLTGYDTKDGPRFCVVWVKHDFALGPKQGTVVRAGEWEYLVDATKEGARKWLTGHKLARHSVVWLDAYQCGAEPKFAAVAALDARQPYWSAKLDTLHGAPGVRLDLEPDIDRKVHSLVSLSSYTEGGANRSAALWHPGPRRSEFWSDGTSTATQSFLLTEFKRGAVVRQLRPRTKAATLLWAAHADGLKAEKGEHVLIGSAQQVADLFRKYPAPGHRPGSVAATTDGDKLVYAATVYPDPGAADYKYELDLTVDGLTDKFKAHAAGGFSLVSLTGHDTNSGTRFCAVWVKYAPKKDEPKASVALDAKDGRIVVVAGYEYLLDATHAGTKKWLDAQKTAKHSVLWLDAYQVGSGAKFAAVAALDSRQPDWLAALDTPPARLPEFYRTNDIRGKGFVLVSYCMYSDNRERWLAHLYQPGPMESCQMNEPALEAERTINRNLRNGSYVRQLRPDSDPTSGTVVWSYFWDRPQPGKEPAGRVEPGAHLLNGDTSAAKTFLDKHRGNGLRLGSVAACEHKGQLVFGATAYPDDRASDSRYEIGLTLDELEAKARTHAGFTPVSLTGYDTKDGTRFCVVWVKYAPKATVELDAKEGATFRAGGYEYLIDATKDGAKKWLDAHKTAKHSVMWLDGYDVGGRGAFCAVAALDDRQPKWEAFLDSAHLGFDPKRFIDIKAHTLVSLSAYYDVSVGFSKDRVASLWHPGTRESTFRAQSDQLWVEKDLPALARGDTVIRQLRPSQGMPRDKLFKEARYWSWHYGAPEEGEKGAHVWGKSGAEVATFLAKYRAPGMRPGSVAACVFDGELVYGATVCSDKGATDWVAELSLTASDLKTKAGELGPKGFVPVSLTGYRTKDGVRFCAVWVKYVPPPK